MTRQSSSSAIIVMTRAPIPGATKTRLEGSLTSQQCAELHKAFLLDTLDLTGRCKNVTVFLAFTPKRHRQFFEKLPFHPAILLPQHGKDLGERIFAAIKTVSSRGYDTVIVIGSDTPTLQPSHIEKAFKALKKADVCLGPARDGGYYLIGMNQPHKGLFEEIPWGTEKVFQTTLNRAQVAGLKTSLLPRWYDVDTPEDLRDLCNQLAELKKIPGAFIPHQTLGRVRNFLADVL
jgi:rSAM/selenodomain-associated transferase 1